MIRLRNNDVVEHAIANGAATIPDKAEQDKFLQRRRDLVQTLRSVPAGKEKELLDNFREGLSEEEKTFLDSTLEAPVFIASKPESMPIAQADV